MSNYEITIAVESIAAFIVFYLIVFKWLLPRLTAHSRGDHYITIPTRIVRFLGANARFWYLLFESSDQFLSHWKRTRPTLELNPVNEIVDRQLREAVASAESVTLEKTETKETLTVVSRRRK